eukprot:comp21617_c0_seq1/m.47673 comp21617_c0_seq1/g.47673  ORF comp21617_c0_seq1/g.47673 comp21617_c0_seq1/m.47673 type:complete len:437 (+) comp21617_c0_seq1:674-1984(+)
MAVGVLDAFLCDDVDHDEPQLVLEGHGGIREQRRDQAGDILELGAVGVLAHCEVLLGIGDLLETGAVEHCHELACNVDVHRVLCKQLLVLRHGAHGLGHLLEIGDLALLQICGLVVLEELVKVVLELLDAVGNEHVPHGRPDLVVLVEQHVFFLFLAGIVHVLVLELLAVDLQVVVGHRLVVKVVQEQRQRVHGAIDNDQCGARITHALCILGALGLECREMREHNVGNTLARALVGIADVRELVDGDEHARELQRHLAQLVLCLLALGRVQMVEASEAAVEREHLALDGKIVDVQLLECADPLDNRRALEPRKQCVFEMRAEKQVHIAVLGLLGVLVVRNQLADALVARRQEIDSFNVWQALARLFDTFDKSDAVLHNVVHSRARRDDPHGDLVDNQHFPARGRLHGLDHLVHETVLCQFLEQHHLFRVMCVCSW